MLPLRFLQKGHQEKNNGQYPVRPFPMPNFLRNDNYLLSSKRHPKGRELNMLQEHEVSNINYLLKNSKVDIVNTTSPQI